MTIAWRLQSILNFLDGLGRDENIGKKGTLTPSAIFLIAKQCIFLVKVLNLSFHGLYIILFSVSIVFGIVLVSIFEMDVVLIVQIAIIIKLLVHSVLKEMLFGHFGEGLKMFFSKTGSVVQPIALDHFLEAKLVTHSNLIQVNINKHQSPESSQPQKYRLFPQTTITPSNLLKRRSRRGISFILFDWYNFCICVVIAFCWY